MEEFQSLRRPDLLRLMNIKPILERELFNGWRTEPLTTTCGTVWLRVHGSDLVAISEQAL
jgi:hypothetical protein